MREEEISYDPFANDQAIRLTALTQAVNMLEMDRDPSLFQDTRLFLIANITEEIKQITNYFNEERAAI